MSDFDKLGKKIGEVDDVVEHWIKKLGLNYNSFAVLYSLAAAPNEQCTQKYICDEWLLPKQTVFNICKDYKEKGWITFSQSTTDKRERIMQLTEAGKAQARPVLQTTEMMSKHSFDAFGEEKTVQLFSLLTEFCVICRKQIDEIQLKN
ncbi:MAG TPA: MarR family transcriptional regulator [Pasteurellaceae bacterium]|nr:MarR family transcriptional regulator [Pasteurellaceae bacterium]